MVEKTPERNPKTTKHYKRETWRQVVLPILLVTALLIIFAALLLPLFGVAGVSIMADYSVLFIFALVTTFWFGGIIVLGGLIYAMAKALEIVPPNTYKAQKALITARDVTDKYTDKMAQVIIEQRSRAAGITTVRDKIRGDKPSRLPTPKPKKVVIPTGTTQEPKLIIIRGKINDE